MKLGPIGINMWCHFTCTEFWIYNIHMLGMPQKWLWYIGRHKLLFVDKDKEWEIHCILQTLIIKKPNQPIPLLVKPSVLLTFNFSYLYHHIGITVYAQLVSDRLSTFGTLFTLKAMLTGIERKCRQSFGMLALHFQKHQGFLPLVSVSLSRECWNTIIWNSKLNCQE